MLSTQSLCRRGFVAPPSLLKAVFDLEEVPVGNEVERYRKKYEKNCKELARDYLYRIYRKKEGLPLVQAKKVSMDAEEKSIIERCRATHTQNVRTAFVWRGSSSSGFKEFVERSMNSVYFGVTNCILTWSQWLLLTSEGQHLLDKLKNGTKMERIYALATLQIYIVQIYISSSYDDVLFRKEFFRILPAIEPIFNLSQPIITKLTTMALLGLLKNAMIKYYKVPEQFFVDFAVISQDETIFIGSKEKENDS